MKDEIQKIFDGINKEDLKQYKEAYKVSQKYENFSIELEDENKETKTNINIVLYHAIRRSWFDTKYEYCIIVSKNNIAYNVNSIDMHITRQRDNANYHIRKRNFYYVADSVTLSAGSSLTSCVTGKIRFGSYVYTLPLACQSSNDSEEIVKNVS